MPYDIDANLYYQDHFLRNDNYHIKQEENVENVAKNIRVNERGTENIKYIPIVRFHMNELIWQA